MDGTSKEKFPYPAPTEEELIEINRKLFSDTVTTLNYEERVVLADKYLDYFTYKKVDDGLLSQAQVSLDNIKPHVAMVHRNKFLPGCELAMRANYVQMLRQMGKDDVVPPYSRVRLIANTTPAAHENKVRTNIGAWPPKGEDVRIIREPFLYSANEGMVKQYEEKEKSIMIEAGQELNQGKRLIGEKHQVPSTDIIGEVFILKP